MNSGPVSEIIRRPSDAMCTRVCVYVCTSRLRPAFSRRDAEGWADDILKSFAGLFPLITDGNGYSEASWDLHRWSGLRRLC